MAHTSAVVESGIRSVLVFGSNRIAFSILKALASSTYIRHLHIVTSPSHIPNLGGLSVRHYTSDFSSCSLDSILFDSKPDLAISTTSAGSHSIQQRIIDSAIKVGVERFAPAEFDQDSLNANIQERLPQSRERARTIQYLEAQAEANRIQWCGISTGCILDDGIVSGRLGFDLKWQSATVHGSGQERFAASSTRRVGDVVAAVVEHWNEVVNQYLYAAGLITTAQEIINSLQRHTGQSWEIGHMDVEEIVQEAERRIDRGFPDAGMFLMERSVLYDKSVNGMRPFEEDDASARLSLENEDLGHLIGDLLYDFTQHGKADCGCE